MFMNLSNLACRMLLNNVSRVNMFIKANSFIYARYTSLYEEFD